MATKQPSRSGERPVADPPSDDEQAFDPSHFGRHQLPEGLRTELIRAEKPRVDPRFLQDTLPPNRTPPAATDPATTPRGGFVAPKPPGIDDRDAPTLIAVPPKTPRNVPSREPAEVLTVKARPQPAATPRQGRPFLDVFLDAVR